MGVVVESEERGPDGRVQGKGISKILKKDLKSKFFTRMFYNGARRRSQGPVVS